MSDESSDDSDISESDGQKQPKWHTFHNDPVLDIVLKSSDDVYFRASSYALKRES